MGKSEDSDTKNSRNNTTTVADQNIVKDMDVYKNIVLFEEEESLKRSSEEDAQKFYETCNLIRKNMALISKLKSSTDTNTKDQIKEFQIETALAFMELKKLNRMEKFRTKHARDSLNTAKANVDNRHLQLQNLIYEVIHLKKEVMKCLQFKSKDEKIKLVSEEEFYKDAPESVTRPSVTLNDPHQRRLARLEWELTQRKQLATLCDNLTETKKSVATSIESKQSRLDNLAPQLRGILEASKPLQESLGLPLDKLKLEHEKAALLSPSLYILYAKASAFRDACDSTLMVSVEGDEDEAKRVSNQDGGQESDSDNENQSENQPEEPPVHKKRHHRISKEARQEEKKIRLLQKHPLSVKLIVSFKDDTKLKLQFYYLTVLKVITVESDLLTVNLGGISVGDMLVSESVLRELYPGDTGLESPNPANTYQLARHKLDSFSSLNLGIPYRWAQRMAGLHFVPIDAREQKSVIQDNAQDSVESVLREINKRVKARLDLCAEIRQLETGSMPVLSGTIDPIPQKVCTTLHKFVISSWKNYCSSFRCSELSQDFISSSDIFYEAVLRRGNNELTAFIAIKPDYPKVSSIFRIKFHDNLPAGVDVLRDIEREVNVLWEKPPTLSAQLQRLRSCFDIYLETEGLAPREKIFFHPVRGRTRSRPYKYVELGGGIFTHR
ncbi:THO complex subunit 5 homolog [Phymastichus coffea]|uniref:THO complex subunit 5 homolog n=1 Tax=Phymastichus coffea TaxID=108790 RepID=UPI00273A909B|nr:THO complex subunit 5 homolog [Phymastichus coffea]XP_058803326.1 THO complex subunit 5 homolog [Phymastichus coffea]